MRQLLAFFAEHSTIVLLLLGLLGLLCAVFIALLLWRARSDGSKKERDEDEGLPGPVAAVASLAGLELSFKNALKTLGSSASGAKGKYRVPWYLLVGPSESKKSSLISRVPLPRRLQAASGDNGIGNPCEWHFFDGGVVLDASESLFQRADLTHDEVGWRKLLALLSRHRSERPIDGVILALSGRQLLSWSERPSEELQDIGAGLFNRLREIQQHLALRFPVYVVVTESERLPGFSSFLNAVPRRFHQDVFGWSNPYPLETAFRGEWVGQGLTEISERLRECVVEVMGAKRFSPDADAIFRFPDAAEALIPATSQILTEVFGDSAYHEGFFFRGIYFSGLRATAKSTASQEVEESESGLTKVGARTPEAVFLSRLFEKKIFPERGLARPFSRGVLHLNRKIRLRQLSIVAVLFCGLFLFMAHRDLQSEIAPVEHLIGSVREKLASMSLDRDPSADSYEQGERYVIELLEEMADVEARPFRSMWLPSSWFSDLDGEVVRDLQEGFEYVILPTIRQGIVQWSDTLTSADWAETSGTRLVVSGVAPLSEATDRSVEYANLLGYIQQVAEFVQAASRFNQLSQAGVSNEMSLFSDIFFWYHQEEIPPGFFEDADLYQQALKSASERPLSAEEWPGLEARAAVMAGDLANLHYLALIQARDEVRARFAEMSEPGYTPSDLRELRLEILRVEGILTDWDPMWLAPESPTLPEPLQQVLDSIPDTELFDKDVFLTEFTGRFREVRARRGSALISSITDIRLNAADSPDSGSEPVDLAPQISEMRAALTALLQLNFMQPSAGGFREAPLSFAGRPTWDMVPLEEGLAFFDEYRGFFEGGLDSIPPEVRGLIMGVADRALEESVRSALSRAMTYEMSSTLSGRSGVEESIRERMSDLDQAARRMVGMLELDAQAGGTPAGAAVAEVIILEGSDVLRELDVLAGEGLYETANGNLSTWTASRAASLDGFSVEDAEGLEAYLAQQRLLLKRLSDIAARVLGLFAIQPVEDKLQSDGVELVPETLPLVSKWQGIVQTLEDFENQVPGNSLEGLERFVRQDMSLATLRECSTVESTGAMSSDYFEMVKTRLGRLVMDRCEQLARNALLDGYGRLAEYHRTRLQGSFPFVNLSEDPEAPDADLNSVLSFLALYDEVTQPLSADPVALIENLLEGEFSADFYRDLASVREFLAPVFPGGESQAEGGVRFVPFLRTARDSEQGAEQIVDWKIRTAGDSVSYRRIGEANALEWRPGDVVEVALVWASGSRRRPVLSSRRSDLRVEGATATWTYQGPWSLLRLIESNDPSTYESGVGPVSSGKMINLRVQTRSYDALSEPADPVSTEASVFMGFELSPDSESGSFPRFPLQAPQPPRR